MDKAEQCSPFALAPLQDLSSLLRAAPSLRCASVLRSSRLEPLAISPLASQHRFSRSVQEPGWASRRLYAGCRSGRLQGSPEL